MINTIFLQTFFRRNPNPEQILRQASFLNAQSDEFTRKGNDARAKREFDYAVFAHNEAVDMADTADELRRRIPVYTLDIINTQTGATLLHCDGNNFAHFVALCESYSKPFGTKAATVEANIVSNGKLVYSIISK